MRLHFLGGVDTVTGSQHLIEANGTRVLRDCGLYQGRRDESQEVNSRFAFDPSSLNSVVLSHAHIDHSGNLPTLVQKGFGGPIHATSATAALCDIMLKDAAHIQEQDAAYLNQKTNRKGLAPIVPLYTVRDAEAALRLLVGCRYGDTVTVGPGVSVTFQDAGHILGAALTTFAVAEGGRTVRIGFALDLGRKDLPLIRDPETIHNVDILVLESTYGDRLHDSVSDAGAELKKVVGDTYRRGGKVIIPSFALERAQEIIYQLGRLIAAGELPVIPVYVDSPMAAAVSNVFEKSADYLDPEFRDFRDRIHQVMHPQWLRYVATVEESKALTASDKPCVIIAASGMCEHGRILHHLKHGIGNPLNTIAIVGFQAQNTLGRRLADGDKKVRIFGDWFERKAEVVVLKSFSAHADRNDLIEYVAKVGAPRVYLVHGESKQREALAQELRKRKLGEIFTPRRGEVVEM